METAQSRDLSEIAPQLPTMRSPLRPHLRLYLFLLTSLLLFTFPLAAKELRIENFRAQIDVLPDSTVTVTETITAHFLGGPWHGLYREIPVEYVTQQGMNYSLFLDVKHVTEVIPSAFPRSKINERSH